MGVEILTRATRLAVPESFGEMKKSQETSYTGCFDGEGERKNLIDSFLAIRLYSAAVSFLERWIEATTASFWVQEARSG